MTKLNNLSHPKYRPDIDGLRAVAVLAVVAFHAFPSWMRGGFIGVDIFFVISGYLISTIIFDNLDKGTFSFSEFYFRRIRRIFPALTLVLVACFSLGWFALLADEYKQLGKHIAAGAGFISNFVLWNETGYFDNSAETKPLLHLWSLGIEEQFYLVWPLLLYFSWQRKFNLLTMTILVATASFVLNIKGIKQDSVATFYSPQTRFWELLCGTLLAWFTLYKKDAFMGTKIKIDGWLSFIIYREKKVLDGKTLSNVLSFIGLFLLTYGFWRINKELRFPGKWALVPVVGAVLIIAAGSKAWFNRTILSNKLAVWFGLISFPLYLWHWPLLSFARIVEGGVPARNIRIAVVLLSIVLAWITYKFLERPMRFGKRGKLNVIILFVLTSAVGYVGYNAYSRDGLPFRKADAPTKLFVDVNDPYHKVIFNSGASEQCKNFIGQADKIFCRINSALPSTLIIGDSHAMSFTYDSLLNGKGDFAVIAAHGCLPFNHLIAFYHTEKFHEKSITCPLLVSSSFKLLDKFDSIKNVIFITRGPVYVNGTGFGEAEKGLSARIMANDLDKNPDNFKNFVNGYVAVAKEFIKLNKKVTFVIDNPELGIQPSTCIDTRPLRLTKKPFASCILSKEVVLDRQKNYRRALDEVSVQLNNEVHFFDSLDYFCDKESCYGMKNNVMFYIDDDHLSKSGSKFIFEKFTEFIN